VHRNLQVSMLKPRLRSVSIDNLSSCAGSGGSARLGGLGDEPRFATGKSTGKSGDTGGSKGIRPLF
jgi:hypothetical protein